MPAVSWDFFLLTALSSSLSDFIGFTACLNSVDPGESDASAFAFSGAGVGERGQGVPAVDGGFFEHLLTYLRAPGQLGHCDLGDPVRSDSDHPPGGFGFLPPVECVDQAESGPRHRMVGVGFPLGERGFHDVEAGVECEARRSGMAGEHGLLLDGGVDAVPERGVAAHHRRV
ncbi:hypothetical protein OIE68_15920 [Nocardia vinacea]|uniref:Uncharacterized protein n=1 Tax=Nocardia vinacea TaxID=96468 RepID=A0ABZ1YYG2_9NOCA|nr:hypothetical protein OIE68_15920 [Nocardia vinacea]